MELKDKIKLLREEAGWNREEFAERVGVSRYTVVRWEEEYLPKFRLRYLVILCKLFNVSTDYLLGLSDKR